MKLSVIGYAVACVFAVATIAGGACAVSEWVQVREQAAARRVAVQRYAEQAKAAAQRYARQQRAERAKANAPIPTAPEFSRVQVVTFLDAARQAETIADPLRRCLAYPDPPGSHWNQTAVRAYCRYRYQPFPGTAEVARLIRAHRSAGLDALLAKALRAERTDPDARGRLDRIYQQDFDDASPGMRKLLDAWKRQDPHSAFAYAASGMAYAEAAAKARGAQLVVDTPQGNLEAMDTLAALASTDLQRAIALNPYLTPAYRSMIELGGLTLGKAYADFAIQQGLAKVPNDLAIYDQWMWLEQPNWYGSFPAMDALARRAAKHAAANPLLIFEVPRKTLYRIYQCSACTWKQTAAQYRAVAKHFLGYGDLEYAGQAAQSAGELGSTGIYDAEALRFNDDDRAARSGLVVALASFDFTQWAITAGNRAVADAPHDDGALAARGFANEQIGKWDAAERDFKAAVAIDPQYMWAWVQLGRTYTSRCEWDQAWQVASRLVEKDPAHSDGWFLQATVQVFQPRPGLAETAAHLKQHFGADPQVEAYARRLESIAQRRAARRAQAARAHTTVHLAPLLPPWFQQCHQYAHIRLVPEPKHG